MDSDQPSDAASASLALCDGGVLGALCLFCGEGRVCCVGQGIRLVFYSSFLEVLCLGTSFSSSPGKRDASFPFCSHQKLCLSVLLLRRDTITRAILIKEGI